VGFFISSEFLTQNIAFHTQNKLVLAKDVHGNATLYTHMPSVIIQVFIQPVFEKLTVDIRTF